MKRYNPSAADYCIRHFSELPDDSLQGDAEDDLLPVVGGSRPHGTVNVTLRYRGRGKPSQEPDPPPSSRSWLWTFAVFAVPVLLIALVMTREG